MRVLGVDPGTYRLGYGLLEGDDDPRAVTWGVISASRRLPLPRRLQAVFGQLERLLEEWHPDSVAVEEPFVGVGDRRFVHSAIAVGQAQALVLLASARAGLPVATYTPARVKLAVADYGNASKAQVGAVLTALLRLPAEGVPEDASDALAVALCHWRRLETERALKEREL